MSLCQTCFELGTFSHEDSVAKAEVLFTLLVFP